MIAISILTVGCGEKAEAEVKPEEPVAETKPELEGVNQDELEYRGGIAYLKGSETPYTGKSFELYDNEQKKWEANWKAGKEDGLFIEWDNQGRKVGQENYKKGMLHGQVIEFYNDGTKKIEMSFMDGEIIEGSQKEWKKKPSSKTKAELEGAISIQNLDRIKGKLYRKNSNTLYTGKAYELYLSGMKRMLANYNNGIAEGLSTYWHENGQKAVEGNWENNFPNGLHTQWHENGKKSAEIIYRSGDRIEEKIWNQEGELTRSNKKKPSKLEYLIHDDDTVRVLRCDPIKTGNFTIPSTLEGKSVKYIGEFAFSGCKHLNSIIIPESVTTIGSYAFRGCKGLKNIKLSKNVKEIQMGAFFGCSNLENINIPEGITLIEGEVFGACNSLNEIIIPSSVTRISCGAFIESKGLRNLKFLGDSPNIDGAKKNILLDVTPTIYRKPEAKGWGDTWGGRPVKLISEKP